MQPGHFPKLLGVEYEGSQLHFNSFSIMYGISTSNASPFLVGQSSCCYNNKVKGQTTYQLHESKDSDYEPHN